MSVPGEFVVRWFRVIILVCMVLLCTPAGAERFSRFSYGVLKFRCERVRATEHATRGPFRLLERIHGLADIVEGGAIDSTERDRVIPPQPEHDDMTLPENASRRRNPFAQQ